MTGIDRDAAREIDLVVVSRETVAEDVVALGLRAAGGGPLPAWEPGAHIDLVLAGGLVRQYSLCGDPADPADPPPPVGDAGSAASAGPADRPGAADPAGAGRTAGPADASDVADPAAPVDGAGPADRPEVGDRAGAAGVGTWRIAVLREPDGRGGSVRVHDEVRVGDRLAARGPRNTFPLVPSPRYLFIAGGIGITPILPMVAAARAAGAEWRLVYGGRRRASMAFLDHPALAGGRVEVRPQDETGLLDLDALLGEPAPDTLVYCCGPESLLAAVEDRCAAWPAGALRVERFAPRAEEGPRESFEVELRHSGLTLTVAPEASILETVEAAGVTVLSSCRAGTCGTCETGVLDGVPDHRDSVLGPAERDTCAFMMICVSRARTPRLVLEL